ncbi:hypothetical protein HDU93_001809, partial [Gonapodya sp. JEL0774]
MSWDDHGGVSVSALAFSSFDGKIAAAYGSHVAIFVPRFVEPVDPKRDPNIEWTLQATVPNSFVVKSLSWSCKGTLLSAGSSVAIWDLSLSDPTLTWSAELSADVERADFSPDGTLFYTYGAFDRLVKIWYRRPSDLVSSKVSQPSPQTVQYDFLYLQHPRSVLYCEWRKTVQRLRAVEDNVLLTMCRDRVSRLWTETGVDGAAPTFHLACSFDRNTGGAAGFNHTSHVGGATGNGHPTVPDLEMPAVHFLDQHEVLAAIEGKSDREEERRRDGLPGGRMHGRTASGSPVSPSGPTVPTAGTGRGGLIGSGEAKRVRRLREAVREHPDMLLQVFGDGTVVLWGIQNLTTHPRRTPKVNIIMRIAHGLQPSDHEFFMDTPLVFHDDSAVGAGSTYYPTELVFVTQNSRGVLNIYVQNLEEFLAADRDSSHVRLHRTLAASPGGTRKLIKHPNLDLVAGIGMNGDVVIWRTGVPTIGVRNKDVLDYVTD